VKNVYSDYKKKLDHFDLSNVDNLKKAGKILIPELDKVLARFYERALGDSRAKSYFKTDDRVTSARNAQKKHWEMLLSGNFDDNYFESTERIGRTHARIDLPLDIYLSSYACASSHLISILMKKLGGGFFGVRNRNAPEIIGSLTRALAFDIERVVDITFTVWTCLLYTSDAADDLTRVDLCCRRSVCHIKQS